MSNFKNQQTKLLITEIAERSIEYLMGLNENNEMVIRKVAEKSSKKLVKAYYDAIKSQHKHALKAAARKEKNQEHVAVHVISARQTNFLLAMADSRDIA